MDWAARNVGLPLTFDTSGQPRYHVYSRLFPDRNVNTLYGYDGLGRNAFVTETGILSGTFNAATLQFSDVTTRTTRTEFDTLSRPVTVTLNYRAGLPSTADTNVKLYTRYDGASNVITQTDALGRLTVTNYDALNRPIAVVANYQDGNPLTGPADADIKTVTRYDLAGRVQQQIHNYENGQYAAAQTDLDRITQYQYDTLSRLVTTTLNLAPGISGADLNRVNISRYDPITTRMLGTRDALGRWLSQQYDQLGRLSRTIQNCTGSSAPASCGTASNDTNVPTSLLYDALGRTAIVSDALGFGTRSSYEGLGRTIKTVRNSRLDSNSGTTVGNLQITSSGVLQLRNGGTTLSGSNPTLQINRLYRLALHQKKGTRANGVLEAYLATDDNAFGAPFATSATQSFTSQATQVQIGVTTATAVKGVVDDIILDRAALPPPSVSAPTRVVRYGYDGLLRLTSAVESPGSSFGYGYDLAGNRTSITVNGQTTTTSYDAANQIVGATYDAAGNLLKPSAQSFPSYGYDGLNRLIGAAPGNQGVAYTYNRDGALVAAQPQLNGLPHGAPTLYTQDLAAPLSQVLQTTVGSTTVAYRYGLERLAAQGADGKKTWYIPDALGSVRRTLADDGVPGGIVSYDPWGTPEGGATPPTFGFAGEQQDTTTGLVNLRARWYSTAQGTFTSRDFFAGFAEQPYSLHPYQYGDSDPVLHTDPSGQYAYEKRGGSVTTWDEFLYAYGSRYDFPPDSGPGQWSQIEVGGTSPATAERFVRAYEAYLEHPEIYSPGTETYRGAYIFAIYFLRLSVFPPPESAFDTARRLLAVRDQGELTPQGYCDLVSALLVLGFHDRVPAAPDDGRGSGGYRDSNRGPRLPMPEGWIRSVEGTTVKTFAESAVDLDRRGVALADLAKGPLRKLPGYARYNTGIAIAEVEEGGQTIRITAVAGRGSGSDLIGTIREELGPNVYPASDMHAEEWLWQNYGDRIKVMGVANKAGPCYTTGQNCADLLRNNGFYNVYWDAEFK